MSSPSPLLSQDPTAGRVLQLLWKGFFATLLLKDKTGRLAACNDTFLHLTGSRTDIDLLGKLPSQYWKPEFGKAFEAYDSQVRESRNALVTREIFGDTPRFTARWPLDIDGFFGSLSIYLLPGLDRIRTGRRLIRGKAECQAPTAEVCFSYFETCPWAIAVRRMSDEHFIFVNRAYRLLFTPPEEPERATDYFVGRHPQDTCPEWYWRAYEKDIIKTDIDCAESVSNVEHPFQIKCPRKVVRFNFGSMDSSLFRATLGVDSGHLETLRLKHPRKAIYIDPLVMSLNARR